MLFADDTSAESRRALIAGLRAMSPERRIEIAMQATDAMRQMIRADIAAHHPEASESELRDLFLERWIGPELAREALAGIRARTGASPS